MKRFFGSITSNVDFVAANENDRMSQEQLNTFIEIINSPAARKVAKRQFGSENAVRTVHFIEWIERAIRDDFFVGGAPYGEKELFRILRQVSAKPSKKPGT